VTLVVNLLAPASVTDDRVPAAKRTSTWQLSQADLNYPGSALSSVHGNAIKRITAGVKAAADLTAKVRSGDGPSPSCMDQFRTKRK